MKICKKTPRPTWANVGDFVPGTVVEMESSVNQFCKPTDLYIVGDIPHCYLRDAKGEGYTSWILADKIAVVNLRTGGVSLVQTVRACVSRPEATVYPNGRGI